jgi:hypothetical protein
MRVESTECRFHLTIPARIVFLSEKCLTRLCCFHHCHSAHWQNVLGFSSAGARDCAFPFSLFAFSFAAALSWCAHTPGLFVVGRHVRDEHCGERNVCFTSCFSFWSSSVVVGFFCIFCIFSLLSSVRAFDTTERRRKTKGWREDS